MTSIYKYEIPSPGPNTIKMPRGSRVLSLHAQRGIPTIWVACDPFADFVKRRFLLAVTGAAMDGTDPEMLARAFVGTVLLDGGDFVCHLFDLGEEP